MINEEENLNYSQYKTLIDGLQTLFNEFDTKCTKSQEEEVVTQQQAFKKRETKIFQTLIEHDYYKLLQISHYYMGKLTLLDEKQALDENDSFQRMMNLFLEENETIPNISNNKSYKDVNKYLITQLYTAFSLLCRKAYLDGDKKDPLSEAEKARDFLKHLNSIKFNKDSKLTNQMLSFFNHNILRIEDIYQKNEDKNIYSEEFDKKGKKEQNKKEIIEAYEVKKKVGLDKNNIGPPINNLEEINYGNVILNDDNQEEAVQQVDSISFDKEYKNIDLQNEEYKREKSVNMRKILRLDEEKLKNISIGEFQELISEVYENGVLLNKEIEDKITGGVGKLFDSENSKDKKNEENSSSIKFANDIEMSEGNILEDEEVIDDGDMLDFEQEEIKNVQNKNSFFEKGESFSKDFFPHNSREEDDKINSKESDSSFNFSKSEKSKSS